MNKAFRKLLRMTCSVYRKTASTVDAAGESTASFDLLTSDLKCLLQSLSGQQVMKYQGLGITAQYKLILNYDDDVLVGDKILIEGSYYYVTFKDKAVGTNYKHHTDVMLRLEVTENGI